MVGTETRFCGMFFCEMLSRKDQIEPCKVKILYRLYRRGIKTFKIMYSCVKLPASSTFCKCLNAILTNSERNQHLISKIKTSIEYSFWTNL